MVLRQLNVFLRFVDSLNSAYQTFSIYPILFWVKWPSILENCCTNGKFHLSRGLLYFIIFLVIFCRILGTRVRELEKKLKTLEISGLWSHG
jgi:hypothetical protein